MTVLTVGIKKTETIPGEFVTDGYTVALPDGTVLYQSRSAMKALVKATVLTDDDRFEDAVTIAFQPGVAEQAGKENLRQIATVAKFQTVVQPLTALAALVNADVPVDAIVDHIKANGNNADGPNTEGLGF